MSLDALIRARRRLDLIGRAVRDARSRVASDAEGQLELAAVAEHDPRQLVLPLDLARPPRDDR